MIKKLRILVPLIILAFSFGVKAEVLVELDCNGKEITDNKSVKCDLYLYYENEGINDIEFNYQTNLDVNFSSVSGFTVTNTGGKILIHSSSTLSDEIMNADTIATITLSANENSLDKEKFTISNIMINKANDIKVEGVSEEFTIKKEEIKLDNVCTLDSITIDNEKVKNFSKDKLEYRGITVTNELIFIDAVRTSNKSSATGLGNVRVPKGETIERNITVTAEDGTVNIYKLFITNTTPKEDMEDEVKPDETDKSSDNTLKSLEIYHGSKKIKIDYSNSKTVYNIQIDDGLDDELTIKATLNDEKAEFIEGYGPRDITMNYGYNKELIKIQAENGSERVITLNINRLDNRDKDTSLASLKINGVEVDLNSEKLEVRLPSGTTKTIIEAIPSSTKGIVKYEDIELALGDNEVSIEVTSEDGQTEEYDVNVIVEGEKIVFDSITITGYNLNFRKEKKAYDLKINSDTNELDITVNPKTVKYNILNNKDLKDKDKVTILIKDDEGEYEYTINIIKESSMDFLCYGVFGLGILSLVASIIYYSKKNKKK